jgi:hypothetical protein
MFASLDIYTTQKRAVASMKIINIDGGSILYFPDHCVARKKDNLNGADHCQKN